MRYQETTGGWHVTMMAFRACIGMLLCGRVIAVERHPPPPPQAPPAARPKIILLLFPDQWRGDWLVGLDDEHLPLRMPTTRGLAASGTRFTQAYVPSPLCAALFQAGPWLEWALRY